MVAAQCSVLQRHHDHPFSTLKAASSQLPCLPPQGVGFVACKAHKHDSKRVFKSVGVLVSVEAMRRSQPVGPAERKAFVPLGSGTIAHSTHWPYTTTLALIHNSAGRAPVVVCTLSGFPREGIAKMCWSAVVGHGSNAYF